MKKILIIHTLGFGFEGMSSVILNYTEHLNCSDLALHFVDFREFNPYVRKRVSSIGTVHETPSRKNDVKGYIKALRQLLKSDFDAIHIHGNSGTMVLEVVLAKMAGVPKIIIHCHNTKTSHPYINGTMKPLMNALATQRLACSEESGKWLYGKYPFQVLNNAIDLKKFAYSESVRAEVREELGIGDEVVVGHIGHFSPQKNHFFLIDIFNALHDSHPNTKLLLVSDGPFFEDVQKKVQELGFADAVIFTGRRSDTERLYKAMDVFVLPSKWEGLPLVVLEAQASGLPTLASSVVPIQAKCTDLLEFYSLEMGAEAWGKKLAELCECCRNEDRRRHQSCVAAESIAAAGYSIEKEAKGLADIYLF